MTYGGIDLGGTKIEARVFDSNMIEVARHRIPTPVASYTEMLDGIAEQVRWLEQHAPIKAIGLGTPGLVNPHSGIMLTANLPASGHRLATDISELVQRKISVINDCRAFTLSEAAMGAGKDHRNVVGLVIGTGVAGGQAINGQLVPDMNGQHGEYGHLPLPATMVTTHDLPLVKCGCGLLACYETYLAGPGLVRLATHLTGQTAKTIDILTAPHFQDVRTVWISLAASLIAQICRTSDPDMIVLGGGLGMTPHLPQMILSAFDGLLLDNTVPPIITAAQHGDASGALGAAVHAKLQMDLDQ